MKHVLNACLALAAVALILIFTGCGQAARPEPELQIVEVKVPVPAPCDPKVGPDPAYVDADQALRAAPDLFERVKLLLAGRLQRIAREGELKAGLGVCAGAPAPAPP